MIDLFRKKTTQKIEQDISSLSAKNKNAEREYSFLLEFRCRGQLFATLESGTISNGLFRVGKSSQSDLVIPENDRICAEHHLELHFSSNTLRLQAVSGNYFYCNSRKNTSVTLKLDDRISFGDCELNIRAGETDGENAARSHRLEFTNGNNKGEMFPLDKELIKIGSDPENDIVLKEDVVSRFHARIRITENGECWLKDLQSINGTTVNDVKLDTQERMLMDSDEISFASVTMLFLDKRVAHTRSQIGKKILIMGVTIAVVALIFGLFYAVTPEAAQLLTAAEYYTARENFDAAQRMLNKMPQAKNYNNFKEHHQLFNEKLTSYRNTFGVWKEFKKNLENSRWALAIGNCGMLEENNRSLWNWNEESADRKMRELKYAKMLLSLHSDIQSLLHSTALTLEEKKHKVAELRKKQLPPLKDEPGYLQPLRKAIAAKTQDLYKSVEVWFKAEKLLEQFGAPNSDIAFVIAEMEKLNEVAVGSIRTRIFGIINTLKHLQANDSAIRNNREAIQGMRLSAVKKNITFVSQDECLINRQLLHKRSELIAAHRRLLEIATNIQFQYQKLGALGVINGKLPAAIEKMPGENDLAAMMANPEISVDGVNLYDHFFGARYFYQVMQESAEYKENIYSDELLSSLKRVPLCVQLNNIFNAAETTHLYIQTLKKELQIKDGIGAFDKTCSDILQKRKKLIAFFRLKSLQSKDNRSSLIARTAVFYFTTPGKADQGELAAFSEKWKTYQREMQRLLNAYDPLDLKKTEQLRQKLKANGVPGDPRSALFRSMK